MSQRADTVVKFPIGRVVREHRILIALGATPELAAIDRSAISIRRAIETLRRQQAALNLLAARARKNETPEQHAAAVAKNMRRIYACEAEDRAAGAAAPPASTGARRRLRELVDRLDAEAGDTDDGGSAA